MRGAWSVHELAIFSLESFVFGVDSTQIQEIFRVKEPGLFRAESSECLPASLSHHHNQLPLFDLRHHLGFPPATLSEVSFPVTCITFYQEKRLWGTLVDSVQNIFPAPFNLLHVVPQILAPSAWKINLWGFYEHRGAVIPLIELGHSCRGTRFEL